MKVSLIACAIGVIGLVLLAGAGPAYRLGLPLPMAFTLLRWAAYIGAAAAGAAVLAALYAYWRATRLAIAAAIAALLMGATAFGIPFGWQRRAQSLPLIHDISTDLENPPAFEAVIPLRGKAPNSLDRPADLAEKQRGGYPDLAPVTVPAPAGQVFDHALAAAQKAGWEIITADKSSGRIEATDTTRWFGFKDDVVVRLTPWGSGTRVDVRSVSRVGLSDVGTNARRIREFLDALKIST
jgi:hypothetical protein